MHRDVGDDAALSLPSEHQSHCHSVTTIDTLRYIYPRIWTRIDNRSSSLFTHQQRTQHSPKVRLRVPCGSLEYTTAPAQQVMSPGYARLSLQRPSRLQKTMRRL